MKKLSLKILLFLLPVVLYLVFVLLVDPFNYFGVSGFISYENKYAVANVENPALFNLIEYSHHPGENITISDSRFAGKDIKLIESQTGLRFSELYIFDGMIKDMISGFWFANSKCKLKNVYLSVNFNNFFVTQRNDLVKSSETIINDPLLYVSNLNVLKASLNCLKRKYTPAGIYTQKSAEERKYLWDNVLSVTEQRYYKNYSYPKEYLVQLKEMKKYCDKNSINLYFVIPPTVVDMQNLIDNNNLKSQKETFVSDLSKITTTYDLDFSNPLTNSRDMFFDPAHLNKEKLSELFSDIVNKKTLKDTSVLRVYEIK
ncbi:MAG: hypothetical protein NTY74_03315 [Ignavibacteriae bacterium]|nr:hypothetical protein [Ignavibacteriota bacterium]